MPTLSLAESARRLRFLEFISEEFVSCALEIEISLSLRALLRHTSNWKTKRCMILERERDVSCDTLGEYLDALKRYDPNSLHGPTGEKSRKLWIQLLERFDLHEFIMYPEPEVEPELSDEAKEVLARLKK